MTPPRSTLAALGFGRGRVSEARTPAARVLRSDLRAISRDGVAFSVMVGAGETYLPAFALAVGLGDVVAGLLSAVPVVAGGLLQLVSPWALRRFGSYRRWVVTCASLQAASFVPLVGAAWFGRIPAWALLLVATLYWGAGMGTGPAWNRWVGEIVPARLRSRYFARRSRLAQAGVLFGLLGSGVALHLASQADVAMLGFAGVFAACAAMRAFSARFLSRQSEPERLRDTLRSAPEAPLLRMSANSARLLAYMLAVQTSVYVAAPYFAPYMLGPLGLDYGGYTFLIAVSFVGKIVALPLLGALGHTRGARWLLRLGGIGIVPLAALWQVSDSLVYLSFVQLAAGTAWAAYELSTFLLFFEAIEPEERTRVLTLFNLANGLALVLGAALGGALLSWAGTDRDGYLLVFVISSLARALTLPFLPARDAAVPSPIPALRTLGVRPSAGSIDRPVLPGMEQE